MRPMSDDEDEGKVLLNTDHKRVKRHTTICTIDGSLEKMKRAYENPTIETCRQPEATRMGLGDCAHIRARGAAREWRSASRAWELRWQVAATTRL